MAKIVLTIQADNKATQSVRLLNAEVQTLSKTLSTIKVNKNLTTQINALTKHYTALAKAAVRVNEVTTKRQIAEQKLANEVKRGRTEDQRTLQAKARREQAELRLKQAQDKATQSTQKQTTATKQNTEVNKEHRQSILSMTRGILEWQIATTLVMKPLRMLQNALTSINETLTKTEDSVIALQRVLPSGSATDSEISSRLYKIAQYYGQTFENVSQIAQNFARTGMSWADTIKATEAAVLALNVAELDAEEATTGLVAILSQFGLEASDLETVIDKLNKTADNFPVTTKKILAALQRTGSAADNANLSLDQTISLITALSRATGRSGENIGTALNSLIQYSSKSSALETFANLSEESREVVENFRKGLQKADGSTYTILDVWKQVSKEIQNLKSEQADLLDGYFATEDGNALKEALDGELEDIYTELGGVYDTANTFRKNYFIALLGNMDTVEQAMGTLQGAAGYSQAENQKYLDTYTAKSNKLKAQWEDIANSEQGLLGIKKIFVDIGSALLTASKWTGGLRTALIGIGSALATLFAPKILSGLGKIGNFFKNLSSPLKNFQTATQAATKAQQAQTLATNLQAKADNAAAIAQQVKNTKSATAAAIESAETAATKAQTIATTAQTRADELAAIAAQKKAVAIQTATAIIGIAITVISAIAGAVKQANEETKRLNDEAIARANEGLSTLKDGIQESVDEYNELIKKVKEAREVLADSSSTVGEVSSAQNTLLGIQNGLIKSNKEYADSIDLTNGNLATQLDLLAKMGEQQAKQKVEKYLKDNADAIYKAKQYQSEKVEKIGFEETWNTFWGREPELYKWLQETHPLTAGLITGNAVGVTEDTTGFWRTIGGLFGASDTSQTAFVNQSGLTRQEWIDFLEELFVEASSADNAEYLQAQIRGAINAIQNNETYKNAQNLINGSANSWNAPLEVLEQFNEGLITYEEFLRKIGLLQEDTSKEIANQPNDISKVTGAYDDLISKLEELRDLQKESTEWEEKKLAVLEAEQALENAKNEATVRRFNEATGQWEWQTDEKKIAEAEKNLEQARLNLQEASYNTIIDQLENQTATNESILAILKEVAPLLGEDFSNAVQNAIKDKTGVDITQPIITPSESHDNGGLALGKGFINKATDRPESVNNPELTKKILSPVSNAEFNRYVRDMGIMFERSHQYAQAPIIERVGGAVDNRVNNSGQINFAGGLTVGSEQRNNLLDILRTASIVPND